GGVAQGTSARRLRARPLCSAHDDAGAGSAPGSRFRFPPLPPRLLPGLAVLPPADAVRDDVAWTPRSAGASASVLDLLVDSGGLDLRRAAPTRAACELCAHGPPRLARTAPDAAAAEALVPRLHRSNLA